MKQLSRRKLLGVLGTSFSVALAGCGREIQEGEFVIVSTLMQQHPESDRDVQVRVEVENRRSESQPATLTVTLERDPPDGETQTWVKERELNIPKGVSPIYNYRFESVVSGPFDREEYSAEAELIEREE